MKIQVCSVFVDDQQKALDFYTEKLGFVKKNDVPAGGARWLTVVSPEGHDDMELLLEPNSHPAAKVFQAALVKDGIPLTAFFVDDLDKEYERLRGLGVSFTVKPTAAGPVKIAVLDDTCGNLIQLVQK